jgi:hypothetical protein
LKIAELCILKKVSFEENISHKIGSGNFEAASIYSFKDEMSLFF